MRLSLIGQIAILALLCGSSAAFMRQPQFTKLIQSRCYNRTQQYGEYYINGQEKPLSSSMETFIGLLERFEQNYTYPPEKVLEMFLKRFRIDGLQMERSNLGRELTFEQNPRQKQRDQVINQILFGSTEVPRGEEFPEDAFSENEKCALYFMMSHTVVNHTTKGVTPTLRPEESASDTSFVEEGVVSLYDHQVHAISLNRVLLGIYAGSKQLRETTIRDIMKLGYQSFDENDYPAETKLHFKETLTPIYAVTVGDVIAEEILRSIEEEPKSRKFGPNGKWNSTLCPTRYYLDSKPTMATYAELRGAGDGLLLGLGMQKLKEDNQMVSVSSLLRMYYSKRGIYLPGTGVSASGSDYTFCRRYDLWNSIDNDVTQQILNFARLNNAKHHGGGRQDSMLQTSVSDAMRGFETSRKEIVDTVTDDERCKPYDNKPCETIVDIFAVMDTRGSPPEEKNEQKKIISDLATHMDIRLYGGSMTILSSSRAFGDRILESAVYNTTMKGCIGCFMDWFLPQGGMADETYVFESINKTLMEYEQDNAILPGVPGKVVIYFNYAEQLSNEKNLRRAIGEVQTKHRDVPIFAVGKNADVLKTFATDSDKVFLSEELSSLDVTLRDEICEMFSTLQYPKCRERKSSMDDPLAYKGYVTPGYTQYWAMYPEYFLKSFRIKFSFNAEGGNIIVCYSRSRKHLSGNNCHTTSGSGQGSERTVEFYMSNPCKGKSLYSCDPFYFSVEGKDIDPSAVCKEKECKFLDQIKFTVRHEGVSCNGSSSLVSSLQAILTVLFLFFVVKKNI